MADGDGGVAKDCVEGWDPREKKPLEKVTQTARLLELKKEQKQLEVRVKEELQSEQKRMMELQNKLNDCNEQYADQKRRLDDLRAEQNVTLRADQKKHMGDLATRVVDSFLQVRPRRQDDTVDVDVHYLPGEETTGFDLHIGGEGAGSRDAKFPVKLSQKVKTLAIQAATFWGLDPDKVFFLDRDGRIVPDDMSLSEIVLPPVPRSAAAAAAADFEERGAIADGRSSAGSSSGFGQQAIAEKASSSGSKAAGGKGELWTVRGRNYNLTLVRASTVLGKENLNQPKGEKWNDFTFNAVELEKELQETRAKHGDPEFTVTKVDMDNIPSLYDLIELGKRKKQQKRADTMCRVVEFVIFVLCFVLFHFLLAPRYSWSMGMHLVSEGIERSLTEFAQEEQAVYGISNFSEVVESVEYQAWIKGPLRRSVVQPGLSDKNLFVIAALGYTYESPPSNAEPHGVWCSALTAGAAGGNGTGGNGTDNASANATAGCNATDAGNATNATSATNATGCNATGNVTNDTNASGSLGAAAAPLCAPEVLRSCLTTRTIAVFAHALQAGDHVPPCKRAYSVHGAEALAESYDSEMAFSYVSGEVSTYSGGTRISLSMADTESFDASLEPLEWHADDITHPATLFVVFVYTPSLNGMFIFQLLTESTQTGSFVTTKKLTIVDLESGQPSTYLVYVLTVILAVVTFLMELRRIMGCPKRCTFEEERDRCSCWTFVFLLTPLCVFLGFAVFSARYSLGADDVVQLDGTGTIMPTSITDLYNLTILDYYIMLINLLVLVMMNLLFFRYLLMYFPLLSYLATMVFKLVLPLLFTAVFIALAFMVVSVFLFLMYSTQSPSFRNYVFTTMMTITFAQGGFGDWFSLYESYSTIWTLLIVFGFLTIALVLNSVTAAIMLSHKKEKDLFQNYSYHPFWASQKSKHTASKKEFNPATIGYDFSDKDGVPKRMDGLERAK